MTLEAPPAFYAPLPPVFLRGNNAPGRALSHPIGTRGPASTIRPMPLPWTLAALPLLTLTLGPAPSPAQPPTVPAPAAAAPAPDPEAQRILALLTGSFAADGEPGTALVWNSAPINVAGLPGAVYFEIANAANPAEPHRQGVLHVFRTAGPDGGSRGGELRLRILRFIGEPGLPAAVVGLWAAPDLFPPVAAATLDPQADLVLRPEGEGFAGRTACPGLTVEGGAVECTYEIALAPGSIAFAERGYSSAGTQVWGQPEGELMRFRSRPPSAAVTRHESGLVTIDLVATDAEEPALTEGGTIRVHYTGWRADGVMLETSRDERRQPLLTRVPGTNLKGVDASLLGMRAGQRRRAVIPPALAFGDKGSLRGRIPPGATLLYEFEALEVRNPVPGQPLPPVPRAPEDDE